MVYTAAKDGISRFINKGHVMNIELYNGRKTCYQKICKEQGKESEESVEYDISTAVVKEITKEEAATIILKYEWLGTMPTSPWKQFGLYLNDTLVAVECLILSKAGGPYTFLGKPAICLARGASIGYAPKWVGSYLISKLISILNKELESCFYLIAYADWEAGELGHIYQACSWVYTGHQKYPEWKSPKGERRDDKYHRDLAKKLDKDFKQTKKLNPIYPKMVFNKLIEDGWVRVSKIRGRYATVIGGSKKHRSKFRAELEKVRKPYLKTHISG